jgi:stalled ribosome rescue protein Dom34
MKSATKSEVGLWIYHRQAVIVTLLDQGEEIKRVMSNTSHAQNPDGHNDSSENRRDRRFDDLLNKYYDEVIAILQDTATILILGPGESKGELEKRLKEHQSGERNVVVETTDKMTDGQIVAEVRHFFRG